MDCSQVHDFLPEFALGTLPQADATAVRAHLASCDAHADAVHLRAAALSLSASAPERAPAPGGRQRLLTRLQQEGPGPASTSRPLPSRPTSARWRGRGGLRAASIAAALAIVSIGLLAWNLVLQIDNDPASGDATAFIAATPGPAGDVLPLPDDGRILLDFHDLPALPAGREYQVWLIDAGGPRGAGTFRAASDGRAAFLIQDSAPADAIAVTVEPAGGSPQPTSDPILIAEV